MWTVDLPADLNSREGDGYCWSLLHEAGNPAVIFPGAIIIAGEPDTPAVAHVVDRLGDDPVIVRFEILPGSVDDYAAAMARAARPRI